MCYTIDMCNKALVDNDTSVYVENYGAARVAPGA